MTARAEVIKIKVNEAGEAYLNKKHVTLEELKQELARLKGAKGGIWYYLEDPSQPRAKVIERVILDAGLPIKSPEKSLSRPVRTPRLLTPRDSTVLPIRRNSPAAMTGNNHPPHRL